MPDFAYPLVAIRDDGSTLVAHTPAEAEAFNRLRPGPQHLETRIWIHRVATDGPIWRDSVIAHEWIVRDDEGRTVRHEDLPDTTVRRPWYARRDEAIRMAAARGLPIPGTGARRRYSRGYREFAANIAMRAAETALDGDLADWGIAPGRVGRRRVPDLPQVWDDVAYRTGHRCWKRHRRTQWRARD